MAQGKILIVDDEKNICELLTMELSLEGYETACAYDGEEALRVFESFGPDVVLLDIMLPVKSGYEVCSELKDRGCAIIMLSAKSEVTDKISGLDTGADDYMTKPFDTAELLARINAQLRRMKKQSREHGTDSISNGVLMIKPSSQETFVDGTEIKLTVTEFGLLEYFMHNLNKVVSRNELAEILGDGDFNEKTRSIDMHIQRLRKKLAAADETKYGKNYFIETIFSRGYKMRNFDET